MAPSATSPSSFPPSLNRSTVACTVAVNISWLDVLLYSLNDLAKGIRTPPRITTFRSGFIVCSFLLLFQHGKNATQIVIGGLCAVFTDLESFSMFDACCLVSPIPFFKGLLDVGSETYCAIRRKPLFSISRICGDLVGVSA